MSIVKIEKKAYKGWDNCIYISNEKVELIVTTDVGPRVIYFGFKGKENEFAQVPDQLGKKGSDEWLIYGGHRLWHSPEEAPRSYEPDNDQVEYTLNSSGISLVQKTEKRTGMQKEMHIALDPDKAEVEIIHKIRNNGLWPVEFSVWALSVMAPGGIEIVPQTSRKTGFLPNRMISLWDYTRLNDPRVYWGEKYIILKQDKSIKNPFKFGIYNEEGWAAHINHNNLFVKKFAFDPDAVYPDFSGSNYETYTCDYMTEMESLSPLKTIGPSQVFEHKEIWQLHSGINVSGSTISEKFIDESILPLIKS